MSGGRRRRSRKRSGRRRSSRRRSRTRRRSSSRRKSSGRSRQSEQQAQVGKRSSRQGIKSEQLAGGIEVATCDNRKTKVDNGM